MCGGWGAGVNDQWEAHKQIGSNWGMVQDEWDIQPPADLNRASTEVPAFPLSSTIGVTLLPELLVSRVVSCLSSGSPEDQAWPLILQRLIKGTNK